MRKKFTFLTAAIALLVGLAFPMGMRGQTKTEGFETASASTTYNSSATINANQSDCGIAWSIYYGNVSTTSPITGSKSCLMRYYTNSPNNLGYAATTTGIQGLTNVTFNAKVTNTGNKMGVWYSTDGNNWNAIATDVELTTNSAEKSYDIPNSSSSTSYYIKIGITSATTNKKDLIIDDVVFTYSSNSTIYTVTYHANVTGVEDIEVEYTEGDDVTVADNTFNKPGYAFTEWNTEEDGSGTSYDPEDVIENINSDIDLYAQWEESASTTGTINFGNSTGYVAITESEVKGDDNLGNEWTITTVGTTYFYAGYSYNQIGSGNAPASSITFTTTLPEEVNVTAMEAKFGGFSGTAGTITMKVGNTTIGTGSLNAANDVTVNSSSTETGNVLTVTITSISKGVKAYYISYTYEAATPNPAVVTTTTINVPSDFNNDISQGTNAGILTATVTPEGGSALDNPAITWSSSNTGVATIDANGAVTLVAVGTTTITASYAGVEDEYRPSTGTYELTVTDSNAPGTENNPYTVAQAIQNTPATDVYIRGKVSSFYNNNIMGDGTSYRYNISDDGTTTTQIRVYKGKDLNQNVFNNVNDVLVGDEVVLYGSLNVYQGVHQVINSHIVSQVRTCSRTILGYDNSNNTNYGGFYLIASPIEGVAPANVTGMTGDNFDLYRFNESAELEWENWKQEGDHNQFNLESGKGYLYAHKTDVTLTFSGTPYTGDGVIPLSYTSGAQFAGWNLVGNPFGVAATIGDQDFYVIGTTTRELIASDVTTISVMEGIFVEADGANQSVTFTPQADQGASGSNTNAVVLNLTRNRGDVIDRAIVRFGEGRQLHKFQLRENSTKVYFTEGNQDFAVVRSHEAQGEMPVNFKAEENGTYTLSINTENVEMNYLHLIDNMTGMDVDLLQTPSYTFDANTNDYTSRFRLVFSANNEEGSSTGSEAFAFYSNGNWVIGNEGEATLQVIDVNGRIVSNETINGTVATSINATPGVYMLRLVNGNEVKTQKIVVR